MKKVTVKGMVYSSHTAVSSEWKKRAVRDGLRVFVDGKNIIGDGSDADAAFTDCTWDEEVPAVVMSVLLGLHENGAIDLECDEDVKAVYCAKSE